MEPRTFERTWIQGQTPKIDDLSEFAFQGESSADTFIIDGKTASGSAVNITGTIIGVYLGENNNMVPLAGAISNGKAIVTLEDTCYKIPGKFVLSIYAVNGTQTICIYSGIGYMFRTQSARVAYPSKAIPDIQELLDNADAVISDVNAAVEAAQSESVEIIESIESKGAETLESIPDDYTALSNDVSDLKTAMEELPDVMAAIENSSETDVDLDVSDTSGNVLLRLKGGHIKTKNFDSSNSGNRICYVSTNGSDSNAGTSASPFATIQHAIDSGFNRILVSPGEYKNQKVSISGKHGISIICNTSAKENNLFESHKRQSRAKLDNSIDVTGLTAYNSIYRTALEVSEDSSYYKVFVSKTVDPVYSGADYYGRVTTYNAILWEITDDILTCTRLVPKIQLSDCEATAGTFHYDGTYLYVHPTNGSLTGVSYKRLNDDTFTSVTNGFYIYNSTDIYIEGLDIQFFPYYDFRANLVSGLLMRDCGFYFTCYGSAAEYQNCNGDMWECNAAKAGADGFGIAAVGNVSFYNCNAIYCYDDGISHHDEATGIIDGGVWTYCKKGGVTPSFGSHVTVKNVIATHNVYGIYITQSGGRVTDGVQYIQNCLVVDNTTKDIKVTGYDVVAFGCAYGTKEVDVGATMAEYNSAVID